MTSPHEDPARIDPASGGISFIQIWDMPSEHDVDGWLSTMHERIHVLTGRPGFRSMSLHRGLDGTHAAVYAQWDSRHHLEAGRNGQLARDGHAALAQWGQDAGHAYLLDSVYLPDLRQPPSPG